MEIETPELRGRIINSAIILEDEIDAFILRFMRSYGKDTEHQKAVYQIMEKHFIIGKTFGRKVEFLKDIVNSEIFKNVYFFELVKFFKKNGMGILHKYDTYEKFSNRLKSKIAKIVETRNVVAHGKINYDMLMGAEEIKEEQKDREFIFNGKVVRITIEDEEAYNSDISELSGLIKFAGMVFAWTNFDFDEFKSKNSKE
ncbi:hypothetical protein [Zobellia uliginosa]|uniref:hypothetical protein n=1 Tax=Zobellia uliginosa TaxID=143224 RepID=UPI001C06E695|nr:hypothetical protein [Zobellia uliginosa]MBU2945729.1 hypothetical protein [Zobellia uliginosa]